MLRPDVDLRMTRCPNPAYRRTIEILLPGDLWASHSESAMNPIRYSVRQRTHSIADEARRVAGVEIVGNSNGQERRRTQDLADADQVLLNCRDCILRPRALVLSEPYHTIKFRTHIRPLSLLFKELGA